MADDNVEVFRSCFLAIVTVVSVIGNGLVCAVLFKSRQQMTPSSKFLLNLCSCDLVASLLVLPFVFFSSLHRQWDFGESWCNATGFIWLLATSAGNLTLAVVALDRYFAIVRPLSYSVAGRRSGLLLACIWILSTLISTIPFFCNISFEHDRLYAMCLVRWEDGLGFSTSFLMLSFVLPAIVMLVCYGHIFYIACSKYKRIYIGTVGAQGFSSERTTRTLYSRKPSWLSTMLQSPVKAFAVISVILASFFLPWTAYVGIVMAKLMGPVPHLIPWQEQLAFLASLLTWPSHPFVYGLMNRSIRKHFVLQFGRPSIPRNTTMSQKASTVGLLDYTPATGALTSLDSVGSDLGTHAHAIQVHRKSSDDSGRYSMPSNEIGSMLTLSEDGHNEEDNQNFTSSQCSTPDHKATIYLIYTK